MNLKSFNCSFSFLRFPGAGLQMAAAAAVLIAVTTVSGTALAADNQASTAADSKSKAVKRGAQAKPAPAPAPKPIEPLLSRDELRVCMSLQAANKERSAEVTRMQPEITAEKSELLQESEAMKAELATVDRSNADAVKGFNDRTAARAERVKLFEQKVADFNAKVGAFETGRANYGRDCENRKYDEKDEKALLKN